MELLYKNALPFEFKIKSVSIALSDKVKFEFNQFYNHINEGCGQIDILIKELSEEYKNISVQVVDEIRKAGNKKSVHVQEELEFIFICSYLLIDKYKITQKKVASIWGMKENEFSKLGIYPQRCHDAYNRQSLVGVKSLSPLQDKPKGGEIAQYINQNIQAMYACCAFIGITNDLDIFANISCTDRMAYILTSPLDFTEKEDLERANYAYARYVFALGNHLYDDEGKLSSAVCIKDKIIDILKMKETAIWIRDNVLCDIFLKDIDLSSYLLDGYDYGSFWELKKRYKVVVEKVLMAETACDSDYLIGGLEYDEHFGAYTMKPDDLYKIEPDSEEEGWNYEEFICNHLEDARKEKKNLEQQMCECLNLKQIFCVQNITIENWLNYVGDFVKEKCILKVSERKADGDIKKKDIQPLFEDRIRAAACFWINEVFKGKQEEAMEEEVNKILDYLEQKEFLFYLNALNAPPAGGKKKAKQEEQKNIHIHMIAEKGNVLEQIQDLHTNILSYKAERPILIYIDTKAHDLKKQDIQNILNAWNCILVVHDDKYMKDDDLGAKEKNSDLDLYILHIGEK